MKKLSDTKSRINTLEDLGRMVGLQRKVSPESLSHSFLRETNYDVGMEIIYAEKTEAVEEAWQFEVTRGAHRASVRVRRGGRGAWLHRPDQVPAEVLELVNADPRCRDAILSTRKWDSWMRGRWAPASFRRHRSKVGVLNFSLEIRGIEKKTGETICQVLLSVFGVDDAAVEKISLTMPFRATELRSAIDEVRAQSAQYFMATAA